jgi:RecJ-like exonuclease
MRCERCQGQGIIKESWFMGQLCPECNGSGIVYCCDEGGANPPNTYDQEEIEAWVERRRRLDASAAEDCRKLYEALTGRKSNLPKVHRSST